MPRSKQLHRSRLRLPRLRQRRRRRRRVRSLPIRCRTASCDLVVEKTGYPKDMLDLDLDLEADLGVDTVKQAELLAAIRGMYNIPARREYEAARLPDPGARDSVRARQAGGPGTSAGYACTCRGGADPATRRLLRQCRGTGSGLPGGGELHSTPRAGAIVAPARSPSVSRPALRLAPGCRVVIMPDKGGVGGRAGAAPAGSRGRGPADR